MPSPTILFVPGLWEGPEVYNQIAAQLQGEGYSAMIAWLLSTGTVSPGNPSMDDDIAGIRITAEALVDAGTEVIMVLHSAGGFLGSSAIEGLSRKARAAQGLEGGIAYLVILTGALVAEGTPHGHRPFFDVKVCGSVLAESSSKRLLTTLDSLGWRTELLNAQEDTFQ